MNNDERKLLHMIGSILRIDGQGLIWKCQKKHKEWEGYRKCVPRLLGHDKDGYIRIGIRDENGGNLHAFAHRLVFRAHYGDIPDGLQINHKNGIKHDNRLENLELMTPSQQMIHAVEVLGRKIGNHTSGVNRKGVHFKVPREDLPLIRKSEISNKELAEKYGVTPTRICQIKGGY